jgi:hypothetical protein
VSPEEEALRRPRATHDADIVIDPTVQQLDLLVHELNAAGFYVDAAGARAALGLNWQGRR